MRRAIVLSIVLLSLCLMAAKVYVGSSRSPRQIYQSVEMCDGISDAGTDPTDQELKDELNALLESEYPGNTPIPAFTFESTAVPANVCNTTENCTLVGKVICEKRNGTFSKGSTIFLDYCLTGCASDPVRDNDTLFWVAVECP